MDALAVGQPYSGRGIDPRGRRLYRCERTRFPSPLGGEGKIGHLVSGDTLTYPVMFHVLNDTDHGVNVRAISFDFQVLAGRRAIAEIGACGGSIDHNDAPIGLMVLSSEDVASNDWDAERREELWADP